MTTKPTSRPKAAVELEAKGLITASRPRARHLSQRVADDVVDDLGTAPSPIAPRSLSLSRLPQVARRTGLSRASIYGLIAKGEFPQPISIASRAIAFLDSEVDAFIEGRIQKTRSADYSPTDKMPKKLRERQQRNRAVAAAAVAARR
jgi:prophage regulatory protein